MNRRGFIKVALGAIGAAVAGVSVAKPKAGYKGIVNWPTTDPLFDPAKQWGMQYQYTFNEAALRQYGHPPQRILDVAKKDIERFIPAEHRSRIKLFHIPGGYRQGDPMRQDGHYGWKWTPKEMLS